MLGPSRSGRADSSTAAAPSVERRDVSVAKRSIGPPPARPPSPTPLGTRLRSCGVELGGGLGLLAKDRGALDLQLLELLVQRLRGADGGGCGNVRRALCLRRLRWRGAARGAAGRRAAAATRFSIFCVSSSSSSLGSCTVAPIVGSACAPTARSNRRGGGRGSSSRPGASTGGGAPRPTGGRDPPKLRASGRRHTRWQAGGAFIEGLATAARMRS